MRAASRTLQICSEEALAGAGIALQACIDRVIVLLRAEEAAAQKIAVRNELALAWLALQKGRDELRQAYVDSLGRALERTLRNPVKTGFGGSDFGALDAPVSAPGELTLVGHHQVEKDLAVRRLLQQVAPLVDAQVGELDGLVSGALGLDRIDPERNPFRPELFVPVLQSLLDDQPLDPGLRAHWSRHLGGAFGRELGAVLTRIADSQDRLVAALTSEDASPHIDAESRMRLRSIDVQLLRILEEMSAGRQESVAEMKADLVALTNAVRQLARSGGR